MSYRIWPALIFAGFAAIVSSGQTDAPPIRSSFVAKGWFMRHLKDWDKAKIEEIRPVSYGDWTTGGGLFGSPVLSAGWSPAKVEHLAMIHCWRVSMGNPAVVKTYLFAEAMSGAILKVKVSDARRPNKNVVRRCAP